MPRSKAETLGIFPDQDARTMENRRADLVAYTILKLVANGLPHPPLSAESDTAIAERLLATYHQRLRLLDGVRCPADARIQFFLEDHLADVADRDSIQLPTRTITLDRHGLSREMSLPVDGDKYENDLVSSYRVQNGVLHNPQHDRRTTSGTFHVAEGGLHAIALHMFIIVANDDGLSEGSSYDPLPEVRVGRVLRHSPLDGEGCLRPHCLQGR